MPDFDGRGPSGKGPMTGRGKGFCILKTSNIKPDQINGLIGIEGKSVKKIDGNFNIAGKDEYNAKR